MSRETVVLVHGIWMHGLVMRVLAKRLRDHGFATREFNYAFLRKSPSENADELAREVKRAIDAPACEQVHIVAHSLGGIVTMHLLEQHPRLLIGKVVLLGSPVRGSDVARQMHAKKHWRPLLGRSVEEGLLGGGPVWRGQPPLGIINGRGAFGVSRILFRSGQDNDGVVAANETLADAATDAATVPQSHSTMLFSRRCADLCARFIDAGTFS
jgi:pimeloyl-ACP methyl ester carboxylesterase